MISIKFDFHLPGSLNKKETTKEHLIILASGKIKYSGWGGLRKKKFLLLVFQQNLSRRTNQGNLNKRHLAIPCLQQK